MSAVKGLLYGNFILNRGWFIASGILAVIGTAVTAFIYKADPAGGTAGTALFISELAVLAVCCEWLARNFESNLKSRFADYALAGGISKKEFAASEILKNLITIGISFLMCVIMQAVLAVFGFFDLENIKTLALIALLFGAVEWICSPFVVELKSAEKAGLLVGIILGFGVVLPVMVVGGAYLSEDGEILAAVLVRMLAKPWFDWAVVGLCAAIYTIFYFVLLRRIRKGDVC